MLITSSTQPGALAHWPMGGVAVVVMVVDASSATRHGPSHFRSDWQRGMQYNTPVNEPNTAAGFAFLARPKWCEQFVRALDDVTREPCRGQMTERMGAHLSTRRTERGLSAGMHLVWTLGSVH